MDERIILTQEHLATLRLARQGGSLRVAPSGVEGRSGDRAIARTGDGRRVHAERKAGAGRAAGGRVAARDAAGAVRHPVAQGRLLAAGAVRLLPGAHRRPREGHLRDDGRVGGRALRPDARRAVRGRPAPVLARVRGRRRRAVRLLHPGHRAARRSTCSTATPARRATRSRAPSTSTSAAARATRRSSTPSSGWPAAAAGEAIPEPEEDGGVGARLARYDAVRTALGERPYVDDLDRPGLLHGALVLSPHARARVRRIDTSQARALPGVGRRRDRGRRAGRALVRPDRTRLAGVRRRGRGGALRGRRAGRGGRRPTGTPRERPPRSSRWTTRCCPPCSTRRPRSRQARRASTRSTRTSSRARRSAGATPTPRWRRARTWCAGRGRRSESSTCISSRRARWPSPAPTAGCTSTPRGRGSSTTAVRSRRSSACRRSRCSSTWCPTAARSAARRTCRSRRRPRCSRA